MGLDVDLWMLKRMPGYARPLIIEPCNAEVVENRLNALIARLRLFLLIRTYKLGTDLWTLI